MFYNRILTSVLLLGVILSFQSAAEAKSEPISFFPSSNSSLLQVSKNISISVYKKDEPKTVVANVTLVKSDKTEITGESCTSNGKDCVLKIAFNDQDITLQLTMKYDHDHIPGYWEWSKLTVSGNIDNKYAISDTDNGDMNVTPKPGYTQNGITNINCQRDFTVCAPLKLSWTCDGEEFKSKNATNNPISIKFPGLQLQPFFSDTNTSTTQKLRFGANWDCDPVFSAALWVSLLIGLGLIIAFYWAVGMISSLNTPDRFEDPKGKTIQVPQQD